MQTCKYCNNPNVSKYTSYDYYDVFECQACSRMFWKSVPECCRTPQERIVTQHIDINKYQIRIQCDICGGCLNMRKPLSHAKYSNMVKGEFSLERHIKWKESKTAESDYIYSISKQLEFNKTDYVKYLNHLQSPYWKNIRQQVLLRDNNTCQKCLKAPAQEVHHLTYNNLGNENLSDLLSLCRICHFSLHNQNNSKC